MPPTILRDGQTAILASEDDKNKLTDQQDGVDIEQDFHSLDDIRTVAVEIEKHNQATQVELSVYEKEGRQIFRDMVECGRRRSDRSGQQEVVNENERLPSSIRLEQLVNEILGKHHEEYKSMVEKLQLDKGLNYAALEVICDELFADQMSWGRIVALCAFCVEVARDCRDNNLDHIAIYVVDSVWHYNRDRIVNWISDLPNGWNTVEEIFPLASDTGDSMYKTLICAGIGLAAMASLIKVMR